MTLLEGSFTYLKVYLAIALICNLLTGVVGPVFQIYFGKIIENFLSGKEGLKDLSPLLYMVGLGCFNFTVFYIGKIILVVNFDLGKQLRLRLSKSLLLKEMAWFSEMQGNSAPPPKTHLSDDTAKVPLLRPAPKGNKNLFDYGDMPDQSKLAEMERSELLRQHDRANLKRKSMGLQEVEFTESDNSPLILKQPDMSLPPMPPELLAQLPPGFDISKMPPIPKDLLIKHGLPADFDIQNLPPIPQDILRKLPNDFDVNNLPKDFNPKDLPPLRTPNSPVGKENDKNALGIPSLLSSVSEIEQVGLLLCQFVNNITSIITSFTIAFIFDYQTTLVQLTIIPLLLLLFVMMMFFYKKVGFLEVEYKARASHILGDAITNITTIMTFNCQNYIYMQYEDILLKLLNIAKKTSLMLGFASGSCMFIIYGATGLSLYYASLQVENGRITVAEAITIYTVIMNAFQAFGSLPMTVQGVFRGLGAWNRLKPVMAYTDPPVLKKPSEFIGVIEFKDVSFRYPNRDEYALRNISFTIKPGQNIAFVGESGSGKSTVLNILLKYYDYHGHVYIDGNELRELDPQYIRRKFGLVEQNPKLFNLTVIQNILLPFGIYDTKIPSKIMENVITCSTKAHAHDFIVKLPKGYFTMVGEKGVAMSQGQKQRVAITRSLITDPPILLFDEATSALDSISEQVVQSTIDMISQEKTCIQVSHRISSIKHSDVIHVFKNGEIVEHGTFDELVAEQGYFNELVQGQSFNMPKSKSASSNNLLKLDELPISQSVSKINLTKILKKSTIKNPVLKYMTKQVYHKPWMFGIGLVGSLIFGLIMPVTGFLFSSILTYLGHPEDRATIDQYCLYYLYIALSAFIGLGTTTYFLSYMSASFSTKFLPAIFKSLLYQDMQYFDDPVNGSAQLQSRIEEDLQRIEQSSGSLFVQVLQNLVTFFGGFIFALLVSPIIGSVCCAFLVILSVGSYYTSQIAKRYNDKLVLKKIEASGLVGDCLGNIRILRSLNCHEHILQKYDELIESQRKLVLYMLFVIGLFDGLISSLREFLFPIIFYIGYILIYYNMIGIEQLIQPLFIILMSSSSIDSLLNVYRTFLQATDSAERFFDLLESSPSISFSGGSIPVDIQGSAELDNVSFKYAGRNENALTHANLIIQEKQKIGIVGQSGSGKTTIAKLLLRLYDPNKGMVYIDHINAQEWDLNGLRNSVLFISRDGLFRDTIKENILLGMPDQDIMPTMKLVNLWDWINKLPLKEQTMIDANSVSGGQLQRLLLGRILIRRPKLLILDEALSALDQENEDMLMDVIDQLDTTVIIVSHKLSSVEHCDKICVVENGRIIEQGTHIDLYERGGSYYKLAALQDI